MQIILTEEEYNTLKNQADDYDRARKDHIALLLKYQDLRDKYNQLLVHGVVQNNEFLKATYA